ncbi:hypothetical protein KKA95_00010 [Patescibacteria group bacterium]|nr:hypothetical protein [Patescibacteria group bacterium]
MQQWAENIIPSLLFFLAFFIAFSLVELLFILLLNRLEKRNWEFVIDHLIRLKVHHGKLVSIIGGLGIFVVLMSALIFTPFFKVIYYASTELAVLSVLLIFVMVVIYATTTRKMVRLDLEKKVHGYIYFIVSFILYVFIVTLASQSYNSYQNYVNKTFVDPTVKEVQTKLDEQEEERLLTLFREDYLNGDCIEVDYAEKEATGLTHFIYITTDIEFATMKTIEDSMTTFKGYECTDGENTFMLTDEGKWYWVISEKL